MSYKLAIVGYRDYSNYEKFKQYVDEYIVQNGRPSLIISGGAAGIDFLAERYAAQCGIRMSIFFADWNTYGKAAGPIRNEQIVAECDRVLAFPARNSRGTFDTIKKAQAKGKDVVVHYV